MKRWVVLAATLLAAAAAQAQVFPAKPVKLIVPFPAGSATDQIARVIGQELQGALGQPFVVDNKPGAQGTIAAEGVAKSAPDGYTLMVSTNTPQAAAAALKKPDAAARFATLGTDVGLMDPAQLADFIKAEIAKWARMAKEAGIQPQ